MNIIIISLSLTQYKGKVYIVFELLKKVFLNEKSIKVLKNTQSNRITQTSLFFFYNLGYFKLF